MNITISVDDDLVHKARELARRQGVSLQQLLRDHLRALVGGRSTEDAARELLASMKKHAGRSRGRRIRREAAYEGRV